MLIAVLLFIGLRLGRLWNPRVLAPLEDLLGLLMMDVESKQFLAQVQTLAAVLHSLVVLVDLEQEKNVVFVDFAVSIVLTQEVRD